MLLTACVLTHLHFLKISSGSWLEIADIRLLRYSHTFPENARFQARRPTAF
jgi:hypothetical protein